MDLGLNNIQQVRPIRREGERVLAATGPHGHLDYLDGYTPRSSYTLRLVLNRSV